MWATWGGSPATTLCSGRVLGSATPERPIGVDQQPWPIVPRQRMGGDYLRVAAVRLWFLSRPPPSTTLLASCETTARIASKRRSSSTRSSGTAVALTCGWTPSEHRARWRSSGLWKNGRQSSANDDGPRGTRRAPHGKRAISRAIAAGPLVPVNGPHSCDLGRLASHPLCAPGALRQYHAGTA
jgi:hypothetical protein